MLVPCPHCGPRDEIEFTHGGQAGVTHPVGEVDDSAWGRYLFVRTNPAGIVHERWCHTYGCRRWFNARRDTRTNEFQP
jgi:heterotetrameric sarcosine oxidase delta subunit